MNPTGTAHDPLPCFRCGKQIEREPFTRGLTYGMSFTSHGGYGSAVFDACDPRTHLRIDVCDGCVMERGAQNAVLMATVIPHAVEISYEQWQQPPAGWEPRYDDETQP